MKIKLFLTSSLLLLGVWLAAAYNHTVDLSTYSRPSTTEFAPAQASVEPTLAPESTLHQEDSKTAVATK